MADTPIFSDAFAYTNGNLTGKGSPAWLGPFGGSSCVVSSSSLAQTSSISGTTWNNSQPQATVTDCYATIALKFSRVNAEDHFSFYMRMADVTSAAADYVRVLFYATGRVRMIQRSGGTITDIYDLAAGSTGSPSLSANTFYTVRFQLLGGACTATIAGTTHTATTTMTNGGGCGLYARHAADTTSSTITLDDFEWGTYATFDPKPAGFHHYFMAGANQ